MGSFASAVALTPVPLTALAATSIAAALTAADGTNGNKFTVNPNTILRVKNGGSQITVTVHVSKTVGGLVVPDLTFTVAATTGDTLFRFGDPLDIFWYDPATRTGWVEFSAVTTVTVKVYEA